MEYTIKELNTYRREDSIVCHITSEEQYNRLKTICPKISEYYKNKSYYLCSFAGYSENPYYNTIEFNQIGIFNYEIY